MWIQLICNCISLFVFVYVSVVIICHAPSMPDTKASIWALKVYGDRALNKAGWHMKPWMAAYTLLSGGFPPLYSSTTVLGYPLYSCTTLLGYSTNIQQRVPKHPVLYSSTTVLGYRLHLGLTQYYSVCTVYSMWIRLASGYLIRIFLVFNYTSLELLRTLEQVSVTLNCESDLANLFRNGFRFRNFTT